MIRDTIFTTRLGTPASSIFASGTSKSRMGLVSCSRLFLSTKISISLNTKTGMPILSCLSLGLQYLGSFLATMMGSIANKPSISTSAYECTDLNKRVPK
jgi:hypothetical protein